MADIDISLNVSGLKQATNEAKNLSTSLGNAVEEANTLSSSFGKVGSTASSATSIAAKGLQTIGSATDQALSGVKDLAGAFPAVQNAIGGIQTVAGGISSIGTSAKEAGGGVTGLGKAIGLAFAASGVGLIISVVNALLSFKEVNEAVNKVLTGVSGAINVVFNSLDKLKNIAGEVGGLFKNVFTLNFTEAGKSLKNISNGFRELGKAAIEGFNAASSAFDKLKLNERNQKLFEQTKKLVEGQIELNETLANNESLTEAQRTKIAEKNFANRRSLLAQELALAKERLEILKGLGDAASKEQKEEIKELENAVAEGRKNLQVLAVQDSNRRVSLALATSERIIAQQKRQTAAEIEELQARLDKELQLNTKSTEEQLKLAENLALKRIEVIDSELKEIRDRAKKSNRQLTEDEITRVEELEIDKRNIIRNNEDEITNIRKQGIDRIVDSQNQLIENTKILLKLEQVSVDTNNINAELRSTNDQLAIQRAEQRLKLENSIENVKQLQAVKQAEINKRTQNAIEQATKSSELSIKQLKIEEETLNIEINRIEALKSLGEASEAEVRQLDVLRAQVSSIGTQIEEIGKQTELKIEAIKTRAIAESESLGTETADAFVKSYKNRLSAVGTITSSTLGLIQQAFDTAFELQARQLDNQIKAVDEAIKESNERIKQLEQQTKESLTRTAELEKQIAQSTGAARDALLSQLDAELAKNRDLEKQKKQELENQKKREEERANLDKQKLEQEKNAARIRNLITIAQAYAQLALAIASAAASSGALAPVTIAAVAAAGAAAIGSTIAAIPSFKKGGILTGPSHEQGGILAVKKGRPIAEVEGGEIILTKAVAQNPALREQASQLNARAGGARFERGGVVESEATNPDRIDKLISKIPAPVVTVVDITEAQNRVKIIQQRS